MTGVVVVAGLDLSLTGTGVALVDAHGARTWTVKSKSPDERTIRSRRARIRGIVAQVGQVVSVAQLIVLEGPSYGSNSVGSWDRAWLFGAVIDELFFREHDVAVAPPTVLKKFASGSGNADKSAVAAGMARLWPGVNPRNDNEFDALTLGTMAAQKLGLPVPSRAHHADCLSKVEWPEGLESSGGQHD